MKEYTLYEICKKIIGNIDPSKEPLCKLPCEDNLNAYMSLINEFLKDLIKLSKYSSSDYYSKQVIGKKALNELRRIHSNIESVLKLKVGE